MEIVLFNTNNKYNICIRYAIKDAYLHYPV